MLQKMLLGAWASAYYSEYEDHQDRYWRYVADKEPKDTEYTHIQA